MFMKVWSENFEFPKCKQEPPKPGSLSFESLVCLHGHEHCAVLFLQTYFKIYSFTSKKQSKTLY